jgi:hypothetical protein
LIVPNIEITEPKRTKLRTDKLLPKCAKSKTLALDPNRPTPETETLLPNLAKLRTDKELPK